MKGSLRQRSPGSWELTVDLDRNGRSKRRMRGASGAGGRCPPL